MGSALSLLGLSIDDQNNMSWLQFAICSLVPFGQMWARIFYMNGSLDKWWTFIPIFFFPPFQFIPMLMMKYGYIQRGEGADVIDKWIAIPIIAKFLIPFIVPVLGLEDGMINDLVQGLIMLGTILIPNMIRRSENCKDGITSDSVGKGFMDSVVEFSLPSVLLTVIPYLPMVGSIVSIVQSIPLIGDFANQLIWVMCFAFVYVVVNIINQNTMATYCTAPLTGNTQDKIIFWISIALKGISYFADSAMDMVGDLQGSMQQGMQGMYGMPSMPSMYGMYGMRGGSELSNLAKLSAFA